MNLTRTIARMIALGWYEYDKERENLAKPERLVYNKKMVVLYEQLAIKGQEEFHRLRGENKN